MILENWMKYISEEIIIIFTSYFLEAASLEDCFSSHQMQFFPLFNEKSSHENIETSYFRKQNCADKSDQARL